MQTAQKAIPVSSPSKDRQKSLEGLVDDGFVVRAPCPLTFKSSDLSDTNNLNGLRETHPLDLRSSHQVTATNHWQHPPHTSNRPTPPQIWHFNILKAGPMTPG